MKVQIDNKWYQTISQEEMPAYLKQCRELNKLAIPKIYRDNNGKHNVYEMLEQKNVELTFDDIKSRLVITSLQGERIEPKKKVPVFMLNSNSRIFQWCDNCNTETNHVDIDRKTIACKCCGLSTELRLYSKVD